jgi:predicted RNase H-like HicB family nuclease
MKDYHINVFWSDEDGCYVADIPDLVSCTALGTTPQEAVEQLATAKDVWLEAARAEGKPIPRPTYRPAIYQAVR